MRERLVSVLAGRAIPFLRESKPSELLPFTGNFPIIGSNTEMNNYLEVVQSKFLLEDLDDKNQRITLAGNKISLMHNSFKEYLKNNNMTFEELSSKEKTNVMLEWMQKDCLTPEALKINV